MRTFGSNMKSVSETEDVGRSNLRRNETKKLREEDLLEV